MTNQQVLLRIDQRPTSSDLFDFLRLRETMKHHETMSVTMGLGKDVHLHKFWTIFGIQSHDYIHSHAYIHRVYIYIYINIQNTFLKRVTFLFGCNEQSRFQGFSSTFLANLS